MFVAGFFAGLVTRKQMLSGDNAVSIAHLLEAAGRKKAWFCPGRPNISDNLIQL